MPPHVEEMTLDDELLMDRVLLRDSEEFGGRRDYEEDDEVPPAWDLPEELLGGLPMGFEKTRRKCVDLTELLDEKKQKIDDLLDRMAKLQARFAAMVTESAEVQATLKKAARPERRAKAAGGKENTNAAPLPERRPSKKENRRVAHPLDDHPDFLNDDDCSAQSPRAHDAACPGDDDGHDGPFRHPLDDHFELGTDAEDAARDAEAEAVKAWIVSCKNEQADPFGKIQAAFDTIKRAMQRVEGSSTQNFGEPRGGGDTEVLDLLEVREAALYSAQADLMALHDDTDAAVDCWTGCYFLENDANDADDDVSPEETKVLLHLGASLHDFVQMTHVHQARLLDVSDRFDFGMF